jgi:hypothetical protein
MQGSASGYHAIPSREQEHILYFSSYTLILHWYSSKSCRTGYEVTLSDAFYAFVRTCREYIPEHASTWWLSWCSSAT